MIGDRALKAIAQSKDLAQHTWAYYKLKLFAQAVSFISMLIKVLIIGGLSMVALLFLGIALAQFLGEVLGDEMLGYGVVGGIFLLVVGIVYWGRKCIENKIVQKLSKHFFET